MGDLILAPQIAQRVLQLGKLDEQIVLRVEERGAHGALEVEGQPFLNAAELAALGEVHEQHQVEHQRRRQDAVAAQEVDLDLHGIIEPAEDIHIVPALFVVAARLVIVDMYLMLVIAVKLLVELRLQNVFQHRQLAGFLGAKGRRVVQHVAVAVAQDVARKPAVQAELARLEGRRQDGFHERLAGLEILAAHGYVAVVGQLQQRRDIDGQIRGAVAERYAGHQRGVGVNHAGGNGRVVVLEAVFEVA